MATEPNRFFFSIYFPSRTPDGQLVKRNVCVAFNATSEKELFRAASRHSATDLKRILAVFSYDHLVRLAERENRRVGEFIKLRLAERLGATAKRLEGRYVRIDPRKLARWRKSLAEVNRAQPLPALHELDRFLESLGPDLESALLHPPAHAPADLAKIRPRARRAAA